MILTTDTLELAQELGSELLRRQWQISCAESCTGGGIGYAITSTAGSSAWFEQGFLTYSNSAKQRLLGVSAADLCTVGAVSATVAEQMASGAARAAAAQVAIAVTGIAGPTGGSTDKPVGTVWFGLWIDGDSYSQKRQFDGDRQQIREQTIRHGLTYALGALSELV